MTESQQLREQMWDFVYGLLEAGESQALIARIKSDPAAARLYAEVRLQADLVGYAARIDDASFVLNADVPSAAASPHQPASARPERSAASARERRSTRSASRRRAGAWLALGAATALAALLAVGQFWPRPNEQQLAAAYIVTEVEAPRAIPGGLGNSLAFNTTTLAGAAQPATVDFAILGRSGQELFRSQVRTDDAGRADVAVPGSALEPGVRLEVLDVAAASLAPAEVKDLQAPAMPPVAVKLKKAAELAADLPVQPEPQMAYVLLEEPLSAADRPVNASVWNFGVFSGKPAAPAIADQVAQSIPGFFEEGEAATASPATQGVVRGIVQNQSPEGRGFGFAYQSNASRADGYGVAPAEQATASPRQAGQSLGVAAEQDGGQAGGLGGAAPVPAPERRLERTAQGFQQQAQQAQPDAAQNVDAYARFGINRADSTRGELSPPQAAATNVAAGEPINVEIPPSYAGKSLVVAANARGVNIANASIIPSDEQGRLSQAELKQQSAGRPGNKSAQLADNVQINLPPEADGPIEVAVLDPASSPPQVVSHNYFYREPARKLQIDVRELKERFAPGERVQITLAVRDEAGQPAADTRLGVRLWNEQLVQQSTDQPLLLADALQSGLPGAVVSQLPVSQAAALPALQATAGQKYAASADSLADAGGAMRQDRPELGRSGEDSQDASRLARREGKSAIPPQANGIAPAPSNEPASVRFDRAEGQSAGMSSPKLAEKPQLPAGGRADFDVPEVESLAAQRAQWYSDYSAISSPEPVELASNRVAMQAAYDASAGASRAQRRQFTRVIGGILVAGGVVLLGLLVVLAVRRVVRTFAGLAPALAVSLASLLIGVIWMGWLPRGDFQPQIVMTGAAPAAAEPVTVSSDESLAEALAPDSSAPPTIALVDPAGSPSAAPKSGTTLDREDFTTRPADAARAPTLPLATGGAFSAGRAAEPQAGQGGLPGGQRGRVALGAAAKEEKALSDQSNDKAAAGIAAGAVQPPPQLAPAAPAASAPSQPAAARPEGAIADGRKELEKAARSAPAPAESSGTTVLPTPAALYFNPNLQTNNQGLATIEFTMPPVNSQYRLLIDALGNGRIGSRQDLLTIQGEAAK